jgi:hypothetical protein
MDARLERIGSDLAVHEGIAFMNGARPEGATERSVSRMRWGPADGGDTARAPNSGVRLDGLSGLAGLLGNSVGQVVKFSSARTSLTLNSVAVSA